MIKEIKQYVRQLTWSDKRTLGYRIECLERSFNQLRDDMLDDFFPALREVRYFLQKVRDEEEKKAQKKEKGANHA